MKKASEINAIVAIVATLCCAECESMVILFTVLTYLGLSAWAFIKNHEEDY